VAAVANISEAAAVAALIVTPPAEAAKVVEECAAAGVKKVWLYRAVGTGCATPEAISAARKAGMETVEGECPMMWLEKTEWFHGVHKTLRGVFGQLPR
jgi:predicted CoA-binding protein